MFLKYYFNKSSCKEGKRSNLILRWIDRYIGIPLIYLLSLIFNKNKAPIDVKRIAFIQPTAIGDLVLSSSVISAIRIKYPESLIYIIHGKSNAAALELLETDIISICCDFTKIFRTIYTLRTYNFDLLIDLCPWARTTALISKFSNSKFCIGFKSLNQYRHFLYDDFVTHSCSIHESENLGEFIKYFKYEGVFKFALKSVYPSPNIDLPFNKLIILHCYAGGSQSLAKSWPDVNWLNLAQRLSSKGYYLGFSGSSKDSNRIGILISNINMFSNCINLSAELNLAQFAYVLQKSRLLITVDTGVLHIASALQCNVIGLHGPTHSARWGAINHNSISIDSDDIDSGYISFGFESHSRESEIMKAITVDVVEKASNSLLFKPPNNF